MGNQFATKIKTSLAFTLLMTIIACTPIPSAGNPIPASTLFALATPPPSQEESFASSANVPTPRPTRQPPEVLTTTYTVSYGDTLIRIATIFGVSIDDLLDANGLTDPNQITIGQVLHIPLEPEREGPGEILIPDSELVYGPAFINFDTAKTIERHPGWLKAYVETVGLETLSGPEIVERIAIQYSVGPRVLLTLIEMKSGGLTAPTLAPELEMYPLGYIKENWDGLTAQLMWAADTLNAGFYGWLSEDLWSLELQDGSRVQLSPALNAGTAGVQQMLAYNQDYDGWAQALETFSQIYEDLWGSPFQYSVEPLLPSDLTAPALTLPWPVGETWYFTGGPHGGWGSGSAWAALDFVTNERNLGCTPSTLWVTSATTGKILLSENGMVLQELDHDGAVGTGWVILYMHIAEEGRIATGRTATTGDRIGHPSCEGGVSNASHLHFARRYNGVWIAADHPQWPLILDNWYPISSEIPYNGTLIKGDLAKTAEEDWSSRNAIQH